MGEKIELLTGVMVQRKHCSPEAGSKYRKTLGFGKTSSIERLTSTFRGNHTSEKRSLPRSLEAILNSFLALDSVEDQGRATRTMQGLR